MPSSYSSGPSHHKRLGMQCHDKMMMLLSKDKAMDEHVLKDLNQLADDAIEFYLPQLCLLAAVREEKAALRQFLLSKAGSSTNFALKMYWQLQSIVEDGPSELLEAALSLSNSCETAVVNATQHSRVDRVFREGLQRSRHRSSPPACSGRPQQKDNLHRTAAYTLKSLYGLAASNRSQSKGSACAAKLPNVLAELGEPVKVALATGQEAGEMELQHYLMKQQRCEYFNVQHQFASVLTGLSNALATIPDHAQRQLSLRECLGALDRWLFDRMACLAVADIESAFLLGLQLPILATGKTRRQVVRVHPEQCRIFSSATRAPFLFVYETIDLDEITERDRASALSLQKLSCFDEANAVTGITAGKTSASEEELRENHMKQAFNDLESGIERHARSRALQTQATRRRVVRLTAPQWSEVVAKSLRPMPPPEPSQSSRCSQCRAKALERQSMNFKDAVNCRGCRRVARALQLRLLIWGDLWADRVARSRKVSLFAPCHSWALNAAVVKSGDDLRQELLAMQVIRLLGDFFAKARLPLWLRHTDVLVVSSTAGMIEYIHDAMSVDAIKKRCPGRSLDEIFKIAFADRLKEAKQNFIESLAAYSLVIHFLQVKDRHNGNLMLDIHGHVIHIDFGFMLSNSPGGNVNFEQSPFKLTQEFIDIMGDESSAEFDYFRTLVIHGFLEARRHVDELILPIRLMLLGPRLPCFREGSEQVLQGLRSRLFLDVKEEVCIEKVVELIDMSVNNWRTIQYDNYQRIVNGIL
mmetsp:Transcript_52513/g.122898  ORF Transcript_52513/g.122898 Transcript_52513/m.122898 type:complete len:756 (+) Transcript_52513:92-2359(+)